MAKLLQTALICPIRYVKKEKGFFFRGQLRGSLITLNSLNVNFILLCHFFLTQCSLQARLSHKQIKHVYLV